MGIYNNTRKLMVFITLAIDNKVRNSYRWLNWNSF